MTDAITISGMTFGVIAGLAAGGTGSTVVLAIAIRRLRRSGQRA